MCGICGWMNLKGDSPEESVLPQMLAKIQHRGPDDTSSFTKPGLALGMNRLAINDLVGGQQPYASVDGRVQAVFNGEIYNFRGLREGLEKKGYRFRSETDGEVIIGLWLEHGPEFVRYLNGMFAIALYDGESLYLFRDRVGIKPLHYLCLDNTFYFASELKCFLDVPGFERKLDYESLQRYLTLEYVPQPRTIFQGARKLPPGHFLKVSLHSGLQKTEEFQISRYWQMPRLGGGSGTLESWAEVLLQNLQRSVKLRLLADVPVGVFLSGGLDSSTLTSLASSMKSDPIKSFSIGFEEKTFDESSHSRLMADYSKTNHHHYLMGHAEACGILDKLYRDIDEPMADPALIPTYLLSRFAAESVTVALAGEGADELLGGYPTYFAHQIAEKLHWVPSQIFDLLRRVISYLPTSHEYMSWDFKIKKFVSGLGREGPQRHLTWMGAFAPGEMSTVLCREPSLGLTSLRGSFHEDPASRAQELDFSTYLTDGLLVKLDRTSMLNSLEARVPFLDHELIEAVAALPSLHKLKFTSAKLCLKAAVRGRVPEAIVRRPKKGFGVPVGAWMRGPLRPMLEESLSSGFLVQQGLFQEKMVRRLVEEHLGGKTDWRKPLWTLLTFQRWCHEFRPTL